MKLKKMSLILLVMLFCFIGIGNVNAETDYSINTSPFSGTSGSYDSGGYEIFGNLGYRVTVVKVKDYTNKKYEVLAKKDYISHNARYGPNCTGSTCRNTANFYVASKKRNRYAVLKNGVGEWKNKGTSNSYLGTLTTTTLLDSSKKNGSYNYDWSKVSEYYIGISKKESDIKSELTKLGVTKDKYTKIEYKYTYTCPSGYKFSDGTTSKEYDTEQSTAPSCSGTATVAAIEKNVTFNGTTTKIYICPVGYTPSGTTCIGTSSVTSTSKKEICESSELTDVYLLIEPMFTVGKGSPQKTYYGTATELYKLGGFGDGRYEKWARLIYTSKNKYGATAKKPFGNFLSKATNSSGNFSYKKPNGSNATYALGSYRGYALGVIWMGELATASSTCSDKTLTCDNNPNISIDSCVTSLKKDGVKTKRAVEICNLTECDTVTCEYTDCNGRKTTETMSKDAIKTAMKADAEKTAEDIKSEFEDQNCQTDCCMVDQSSDTLKCNSDIEVKGTIDQKFVKINGGTETTCGSNYGNLVNYYQTTTGCSVYCKQKVDFRLPGNINEIIKKGTSFKWPSIKNDRMNSYKMNIKSTITCTVVNRNNSTASGSCGTVTDNFIRNGVTSDDFSYENISYNMDSTMSYNDEKYGVNDLKLIKENTNVSCVGCGNVNDGSKFTITVTSDYKLPQTLNKFINSTGEFSDTRNELLTLLELNEGTLAVSKDASKPKYDLKLKFNIGFNNEIGSKINDYVCHYRVSDDSDECVCPEGTKNAGKDISTLADCMNKICVEAQYELCDKDVLDENVYDEACVCKYNHKTVDIFNSKCYKDDKNSFEYCYNKLCNGNTGDFCTTDCEWKKKVTDLNNGKQLQEWNKTCKNGNKSEKCGYQFTCLSCGDIKSPEECDMNPTPCIQTKLQQQNLSYALEKGWITQAEFQRALIACEQVVCPYGGKKIVYRVIDLNDPFPGMEIKGSTMDFTNTNTKGRYPGYNWNNIFWVENKIRNVKALQRNVKDYDLYNEMPLYTIELTPKSIKNIRKYNENHEYTDWSEFNCENGKCMSDFLRKSEYNNIFKSGLCKDVSNIAELKNCYENYSSSSVKTNYKHSS